MRSSSLDSTRNRNLSLNPPHRAYLINQIIEVPTLLLVSQVAAAGF